MDSRTGAVMLGALLLAAAPAVQAHHSFAVFFDEDRPVRLEGTVKAFRFTNPHGTIVLDVENANGSTTEWRVETNAPVVLRRRGWSRSSIRPGERVTIDGWASRDGKPYIRLRSARDAEGRMIGAAPFGAGDD
jgi:DNA/RNA endonuclease YhcR with UshA esterase domain